MKNQLTKDGKVSRFYTIMYPFIKGLLFWLFRVRVWHTDFEPDGTYLICSNHIGAIDPFFLGVSLEKRQPHFMGKKELFKIPLVSSFIRAFGAYSVDRSGDIGAIRTTIDFLEKGECVGVFPQGTRCRGQEPRDTMALVKSGVGLLCCKTKVTVLPACLKTKNNRLRLFRRVDVIFGEPITFEQFDLGETTGHAAYTQISQTIFEKICALYEEELPDGKQ